MEPELPTKITRCEAKVSSRKRRLPRGSVVERTAGNLSQELRQRGGAVQRENFPSVSLRPLPDFVAGRRGAATWVCKPLCPSLDTSRRYTPRPREGVSSLGLVSAKKQPTKGGAVDPHYPHIASFCSSQPLPNSVRAKSKRRHPPPP